MTHSLHRRGNAENLKEDYVIVFIPAKGINDEGHEPKLQEFLRIALRHDPKNVGAISLGNMYSHTAEEVIEKARGVAHAVFDSPETLSKVLKEVKEAELGISTVVSGIFENVDQCLEKVGLKHHTANFSLGIWGNTKKLPSDDILEITTMCGHGLISSNLVKAMTKEVKSGTKTPEEAAKALAPQCACGIFNPARAAKLLTAMAAK